MKNKLHNMQPLNLMVVLVIILAFATGLNGWGQVTLPHLDPLNYTVGQGLQTQAGWTSLNSGDALLIAAGNLSFAGLPASTGNKVAFDGNGIDAAKLFTQQTSGTVYYSFILNITALGSLNTTGSYFSGFTEGTGTTFGATIWSRADGAGYDIGLNPRTTATNTVWSSGTTTVNSTLFIVISYQMISGSTNDVVKMWINPTPGTPEPAATLSATNTLADLANINRILIRQDAATTTPFIEMDELRIGTSWGDVTPLGGTPTVVVSPSALTNFNYYSGTGPSTEKTFTASGASLSGDILLTPPADYEISTGTGASFVPSSLITLTQAGGTVPATTIYVRLKSGLAAGSYNNENIVVTSTGVTPQNVTCSGFVSLNYYSASSGNLDVTTSWGTNPDGTGTSPANFTAGGMILNIRNNPSPAIGANWTVSGTGSNVILGDGTNPVSFTIPAAFAYTGSMDVSANTTLTLQNSVIPVFGTISPATTIIYDGANQNIAQATYGNLTLSSAGTKTFAGNTTTVAGNLLLSNTTLNGQSGPLIFSSVSLGGNLTYVGAVTPPIDGNSITLIATGTGMQTITCNGNTARWFRLQTTTSGNNVVLSEAGGSSNLYVGNTSGGGISLAAGTQLTLNGNTLTFFNGNVSIIGTGTITCNGSSNITINRTGITGTFGTLLLTNPGGNMVNDLTINLSGTGNTVTLGANVLVVLSLTLTSGTLALGSSSTLSYTPYAMLVYNNPTLATTSDIEFPITDGPGMVIVQTSPAAGISLHANRTIPSGLTIIPGQKFIIPSGKQLTVDNNVENLAGPSGLVIKSDATGTGSLIHSTANVDGTFERYMTDADWDNWQDGWHFLSSPVASQDISAFTTVTDFHYDFYSWYEPANLWVNYKNTTTPPTWNTANGSTLFTVGKGYMVAYDTAQVKSFTGPLNVASVGVANLPYTPASYAGSDTDPGWNLLGNPFASAITWKTTGWSPVGVAAIAKIWNEINMSYTDIDSNMIIPASQGFMVNVTSATNSLTIPAGARTHSAQPWYKSTNNPFIKLAARNIDAQTAQESIVTFNSQTTPGYNPDFDSHFLIGYAPAFYSVDGTDKLSTNVLPSIENQAIIPFTFIKTDGDNYSIEALQIDNVPAQVYLTDLKLNQTQNMVGNPVYTFTATDGDDPARFLLSFSYVGINEKTSSNNGIYAYENNLYLVNPGKARLEVYSLTGQKLLGEEINSTGLYQTTLQGPTGYYVVRLTTGTKVVVTKVFIKS